MIAKSHSRLLGADARVPMPRTTRKSDLVSTVGTFAVHRHGR